MQKIIFVYSPTACFPMGGFFENGDFSFGRYRKYINAFNGEAQAQKRDWRMQADTSNGEIEKIEAENPDFIVCTNGLQTRFLSKGFDKSKIHYLSALEIHMGNPLPLLAWLSDKEI